MTYDYTSLAVLDETKTRIDRLKPRLLYLGRGGVSRLLEVHGATPLPSITVKSRADVITNNEVLHVALALLEHHLRGLQHG